MGTTRRTRAKGQAIAAIAAIISVSLLTGSCGRSEARQREMYYLTKDYTFTITPSEAPPHAREDITYKIFIRDRDTREPIQNGEGQIYSNNREGAKTWDGFTYGPEVGTYYGKLNYVASGLWAVGMRFRRDSLHPLEKIEWMQDVLNERSASPP
ncbi:MAG TPA: hypothetical protein VJO33_04355 [Gemmatimonadaceae bacterium]|nr:hypothetical protein [Gemmatimonadaceae bacterium]